MNLFSDDGSFHDGLALWKFYDLINQAATKVGKEFAIAAHLESSLERAGFVAIEHRVMKIPLGAWPADRKQKEMGAYLYLTVESAYEAFGLRYFIDILGLDLAFVKDLIERSKSEADDRNIYTYTKQ
jgi:hypothetical protein